MPVTPAQCVSTPHFSSYCSETWRGASVIRKLSSIALFMPLCTLVSNALDSLSFNGELSAPETQ